MKVQFSSRELKRAIQSVNRAISGKLLNQNLTGIHIVAEKDSVRLTGTNYEILIRCTVEATVIEPGKVLVSGKLLNDLVRQMPDHETTIQTGEKQNMLTIRSGKAVYNILLMNASEYPDLDLIPIKNPMTIEVSLLQEIHKKTVFTVADPVGSLTFSGINFLFKDEGLVVIATDKQRLSRLSLPFDQAKGNVIIPPKALAEIVTLTDPDEIINVAWRDGKIAFWTNKVHFEARTIIGPYPEVEKIIPQKLPIGITVNRLALLNAVERLSVISVERFDKITVSDITITTEKDILLISARTAEKGAAQEELEAKVSGATIEICLNGDQLIECLKAIDTDKITLSLSARNAPVTIVGAGDDRFIHVISPIVRKTNQQIAG